jgi:dienelactone hydrolase
MHRFFPFLFFPCLLAAQTPGDTAYQRTGVADCLPVFSAAQAERLTFPNSWLSGNAANFREWRSAARIKFRETLLAPPPAAPFRPIVIAEQDRGSYVARKIVFNISADSRVLGYVLVPKGKGPFPAALLLHDHGGRFDIGKEKVVEPFGESPARSDSARAWVNKLYDGKFIGDELAKRGYVCFVTDALNWGDRSGGGSDAQQAIASNLFNLGMSFAGIIAWDDCRSADFLASLPEVDTSRIAAVGLSLGSFRTWQLAALSDKITCGVCICWIGTFKGLMTNGNNQTRGQSAFTMTHPGLADYLDLPDVASIACPKPMLFFNGSEDRLFPATMVREAYAKMHQVWKSQQADDKLVTKFWNAGHVFNNEMQNEAFQWLDKEMMNEKR